MGCGSSQERSQATSNSRKIDDTLEQSPRSNAIRQLLLGDKRSGKDYIFRSLKAWRYLYDEAILGSAPAAAEMREERLKTTRLRIHRVMVWWMRILVSTCDKLDYQIVDESQRSVYIRNLQKEAADRFRTIAPFDDLMDEQTANDIKRLWRECPAIRRAYDFIMERDGKIPTKTNSSLLSMQSVPYFFGDPDFDRVSRRDFTPTEFDYIYAPEPSTMKNTSGCPEVEWFVETITMRTIDASDMLFRINTPRATRHNLTSYFSGANNLCLMFCVALDGYDIAIDNDDEAESTDRISTMLKSTSTLCLADKAKRSVSSYALKASTSNDTIDTSASTPAVMTTSIAATTTTTTTSTTTATTSSTKSPENKNETPEKRDEDSSTSTTSAPSSIPTITTTPAPTTELTSKEEKTQDEKDAGKSQSSTTSSTASSSSNTSSDSLPVTPVTSVPESGPISQPATTPTLNVPESSNASSSSSSSTSTAPKTTLRVTIAEPASPRGTNGGAPKKTRPAHLIPSLSTYHFTGMPDFTSRPAVITHSVYDNIDRFWLNRALRLFTEIVESPHFNSVDIPVQVIFTNVDSFRKKLFNNDPNAKVGLCVAFPDYKGPSNDPDQAIEFIKSKFMVPLEKHQQRLEQEAQARADAAVATGQPPPLLHVPKRSIYCEFIEAIDMEKTISFIFKSMRDHLYQRDFDGIIGDHKS
eukprot:TRINITY_DN5496_c0_g1_i1.p1 TRINITY_DN5496_c0_g1~~TRINITY_DN5496_c0_g1_i1.p1  ORF type:complete len:697 (-),score=155.40 TRINITY_DN5496_c0_g1_i1:210-2300(-)